MRWQLFLLVGGVGPLAGCHLAETAVHNAINEPLQYFDERNVTHQLRSDAKDALRDLKRQQDVSCDFEEGFIDGYADALERGWQPLPPAVPPTKYRRGRFLSPKGHARIYDYYEGFHQGSACAAASGKRQYMTIPVLVADPPPDVPLGVRQVPKEECAPDSPAVPGSPPAAMPTTAPVTVPTLPVAPAPRKLQAEGDTGLLPPVRPILGAAPVPEPPPLPEAPLPALPVVKVDLHEPPPPVVLPRPDPDVVVPPQPEFPVR